MVFPMFLVLLLLTNYSRSVAFAGFTGETGSLTGYKDPPGPGRTLLVESSFEGWKDVETRRNKRSPPTTTRPDTNNSIVQTKLNYLNDGHKQLMVHWVGEGSNVIICLAKDPPPSIANTAVNPSAVYISYDYGDSYDNKTSFFKMRDGGYATVDKFYNHPKYNTHFIFADVEHKIIFVTSDYGKNFNMVNLNFTPSEITFHEFQPQTFLILDKKDYVNKLWITEDFGKNWRLLQLNVKSFYWLQGKQSNQQLIIQRLEPSNLTTILYTDNLGRDVTPNIFAIEVVELFVKNDCVFYTMKNKKESRDLYVSYRFGEKLLCVFDTDLDLKDYHIVDITNSRALIAVSHSNTLSHLYVSENLEGSDGKVRFTLSLESVLCYFPNSTWKDSWLYHVSEDAFADVYKVEGMTGIYIASQVAFKPTGTNLGPQHLASRITFDHGFTWRTIMAPERDLEGQPTSCSVLNNCTLHLSQRFNQLYPESRSISILSSKSAPGIIIATGVIGKSLKGHFGVYISTDAGITWRQTLRELYFFNMGDHGGIQTAVKYFKMRGETRHILYSIDEGESWNETSFHNEDIRLYGLMTEPGENTTVFTMFGSFIEQHKWIIVKIDLKNVFKYTCTEDDYKYWSPRYSVDNHRFVPCVLGQQRTYKRRIPHANCYNGNDFDLPVTMEPCECDKIDYECDFGFMKTATPWHCIKNKSVNEDLYKMPTPCPVGHTYTRTKGYRKIPGDVCISGSDKQYLPDEIHCPTKPIPNMLIYAQREKIVRMKLPDGPQETLQIPNLKNVIAIDFNLKNNCVYWADIVKDTIGRLCEDGVSPPEILISTDLVSVEGMALDWVSNNLYFVDGLRAKIELIRVDVQHSGRMRKTILSAPDLIKPRGITVHPVAGYLFWTDWANQNASVKRANLDGSNIISIANKTVVEWPNGITIDYIAERVYWVDARQDYIGSAELDGSSFKKIAIPNEYVTHPFSVAVFKDDLYWDDWKMNAIFITNKDHGGKVGNLIGNVSGLMDLKVIAHGVQEGSNPCANSTCSYICVGSPVVPHYVCLCPDGMQHINGECLCPGGIKPHENFTCPQVNGTCSTSHFKCANGNCIPNVWKCNDEDDCGDNSDEQHCDTKTCEYNHFSCGDGKCIPHYWRCDRENDCSDGSDEIDCPKQDCNSTSFACANGKCISKKWQCDGEDDCRDGSDEKDCEPAVPASCKKDEFKCSGGAIGCIPLTWKCDGEDDCRDSSDETGCNNNTCAPFQFSCGGKNNKCIYLSWVCDGDRDCDNGADEKNCSTTSTLPTPSKDPFQPTNGTVCQEWMFMCSNQKCIPMWWKCDGANDCGDESDEQGCGTRPTPTPAMKPTSPIPHVCSHNQFQCASGECIAMAWVCDKSKDCMGGEDEAHCDGALSCDLKNQFKCKMDGSCIPLSEVCNGHMDCPDSSDESFCNWQNNSGSASPSCSAGYFPCDVKKCLPLASKCDGNKECLDGTDEYNCTSTSRIYQVLQMGVDERSITDTGLLLYWWIPIPEKDKLEFMPSISSVKDSVWSNKTWTEHSDFRFKELQPFTRYNMTVYVRIKGTTRVFPPAKYYLATTEEGTPTSPWNLIIEQKNGSNVLISWNKPVQPNGIIQNYEICWFPPLIKMKLSDNSTAHLLTADFRPGIKYSFYVIAHNTNHESVRSEVRVFEFNGESEMDPVQLLTVINRNDSSVSLSWKYDKPVDGYIIEIDARYPYPKFLPNITPVTNITINNLAPGTRFTFRVSAYKKLVKSSDTSVSTSTTGSPLPELTIVQASIVVNTGTSVQISWTKPNDSRSVQWRYGIYYGLTEDETLEKARFNSTELSAIIPNLDACEKYIFTVGIIGPLGVGPISSSPRSVTTYLNAKAPPKKVTVQQAPNDHLQMIVQWSPSCPNMKSPIGYLINIYEKNSGIRNTIGILNTTTQELSRVFNVTYGGVYEVKIATNVEDAIYSPIVEYKAPPIMPPYELKVFPEANGSFIVYWQERVIPTVIGSYHYEVLVSEGNELNETMASIHKVAKPPFIFNNDTAEMYSFAVRLKTERGYKSILSEIASSANKPSAWSDNFTSSNLTSILIPVCLLLTLLGGALAFYVIKYRRLQNSFIRFANSHYDTRSEAATFDDNVLDEEDSPQIRGFSDDEPLVIA